MPLVGAAPARGSGAAKTLTSVMIYGTYTTSTEAFSQTEGQKGFSLGTFSSGQATLTFPTTLKALAGYGCTSLDNRVIQVSAVDVSSGTAVVNIQQQDGTQGDPGTSCTLYLFLECCE